MRFRLAFEGPLTSNPSEITGEPYRSLEQRCKACVIQGGDEPACCDDLELASNQADGHPCPRREFTDIDDPIAAKLVVLGAYPETQGRYRLTFDLLTEGMPWAQRVSILNRAERAARDEVVQLALYPQPAEKAG